MEFAFHQDEYNVNLTRPIIILLICGKNWKEYLTIIKHKSFNTHTQKKKIKERLVNLNNKKGGFD